MALGVVRHTHIDGQLKHTHTHTHTHKHTHTHTLTHTHTHTHTHRQGREGVRYVRMDTRAAADHRPSLRQHCIHAGRDAVSAIAALAF